jgi:Xylanase inhibitor N-terminal
MITHMDDSFTKGYLATEIFRIGSAVVPEITFGCGKENKGDYGGSSGFLGLAGGILSLISQLGHGKFSYSLQSDTRDHNKRPQLINGNKYYIKNK